MIHRAFSQNKENASPAARGGSPSLFGFQKHPPTPERRYFSDMYFLLKRRCKAASSWRVNGAGGAGHKPLFLCRAGGGGFRMRPVSG
ncbi:MAG: hypothetical protein C6W57_00885 [Caldibacillus debilis]|nr:MAG: hypothetical protein C6W57_00885 [Caldibacillus debilis]